MSDRQEAMLKLEEDATSLVGTVQAMKEEVGSYKQARYELAAAKERLVEMMGQMETVAGEIMRQTTTLNEIGSGDMFKRLGEIREDTRRSRKTGTFASIILVVGILLILSVQVLAWYLR